MKVTIRTLKKAWAKCDGDYAHGITPYELIIVGKWGTIVEVWLCKKCLTALRDKIRDVCPLGMIEVK